MKRFFDVMVSFLSIIFLSPLLVIVSLVIKVVDSGPVFYKQQRVGLNGNLFNMYKFRSMKVDADKIGPYYTSVNDPRVTGIGRLLRKTSIDELPQLFNVFFDHMSIVGPRPNVSQQKELYSLESWNKRNSVRPGITGLAQATKRSEAMSDERELLDLEYVDNQTLMLDMKIIFMTMKQIISKGGN
jgi:lipopolysaccharide/colanic/teichoic acid biosynthesis glycosyltransferase